MFLIGLVLVVITSCTIQSEKKIDSCSSYCKEKGFIDGTCFDCVYLESVKLPDECKSPSFIYDDTSWDLCTEKRLKDNTQHGCLCR